MPYFQLLMFRAVKLVHISDTVIATADTDLELNGKTGKIISTTRKMFLILVSQFIPNHLSNEG